MIFYVGYDIVTPLQNSDISSVRRLCILLLLNHEACRCLYLQISFEFEIWPLIFMMSNICLALFDELDTLGYQLQSYSLYSLRKRCL